MKKKIRWLISPFPADLEFLQTSQFSKSLKRHQPSLKPAGTKIKRICSSSLSQLSGQICQIAFVMLPVLALCSCHCAEVWFLVDITHVVCVCVLAGRGTVRPAHSGWTLLLAYHQEDEVSAKTPLRGSLWSGQMTVSVLLASIIQTLDEPLPLYLGLINRLGRRWCSWHPNSQHSRPLCQTEMFTHGYEKGVNVFGSYNYQVLNRP